jgi:hypothetical protein
MKTGTCFIFLSISCEAVGALNHRLYMCTEFKSTKYVVAQILTAGQPRTIAPMTAACAETSLRQK